MAFDVNKIVEEMKNPADHTAEFDAADIQKNKVLSLFSYLGILLLIPLFAAKDSKYAKFHVNQGLWLLIAEVATSVLMAATGFIPVLGTIVAIICWVCDVVLLVYAIIGIVNAVTGKAKEVPFVGKKALIK